MLEEGSKGSRAMQMLRSLGMLGEEKGVPDQKGVRKGTQGKVGKFFGDLKKKTFDSADQTRYKKIFELMGKTLEIGKYAKKGEAETLKGTVAGQVANKVEQSEEQKQKGKPAEQKGGMLDGLFGGLLKGAVGIGAMILALGGLALVLKEFAGVETETLFKAGGALLGLVVIAKLAKKGLIRGALGIAAMVGVLYLLLEKVLIPFQSVNWETIIKAGVSLGGLIVIAKFSSPKFILAAAGLAAIAGVLWLLVDKGLKPMQEVQWETIGKAFVALLAIGVLGAIAGKAAPLIIAGSVALGLLGIALLPFAAAVRIAAPGIAELSNVMDKLADVPIGNLVAIGPALGAIGVGLAAMSGGNLISNIIDGIGSLFGGEGPLEKLGKLGKAAPEINKLGDSLKSLGDIDLDDLGVTGDATVAVKNVDKLTASVNNLVTAQKASVGLFEQMNAGASNLPSGSARVNNNSGIAEELVEVNKQQVNLLSQIKDGIMTLVTNTPSRRESAVPVPTNQTPVKKIDTTLNFNKAMGIPDSVI